jgi:DNA replication protein DnaC
MWMQDRGKIMFGSQFLLYSEDTEVLTKLYAYITGDDELCQHYSIDLKKGIFLVGGVGVGKTVFMMIMRQLLSMKESYVVKPCQQIALEYIDKGTSVLMRYGRNYVDHVDINTINRAYCFDDLGAEEATKHYGNDANVMAQIIQMRYNIFQSRRVMTHFTSNLTADQIDVYYGARVKSRLREMCNWIEFASSSNDKRI